MAESASKEKKPLVGFSPLFYNLAETGRAVMIAKRYIELGGEAIFFSHGGEYEYLAKNIGCKVIRVNPIYTEEFIDLLWKSSRLETWKNPFSKNLTEHVEEEISAYKKTGIKMIVSTNNFPCIISARVIKIPLVFVTPKVSPQFSYYPDDAEFFLTRILPNRLKLKILNWYAIRSKRYVHPFIKVAKKYNLIPPKREYDLNKGDYTLYTDFEEMVDTDKFKLSPTEHYVGPIFFDELLSKSSDKKDTSGGEELIYKHIRREGKSILVSLGSSGTKKIFLQILQALNKTKYNVIAVYANILRENEIPVLNDNILMKKFVPSIADLNQKVDLAVIHGGQGTVYTAAYAGKPVIGFPMQFEQHLNLEILVKRKMAMIASRKYFNEQKFLDAIKEMFSNYSIYFNNAQNLSKKLPKPEGDKNAVAKIIEILQRC